MIELIYTCDRCGVTDRRVQTNSHKPDSDMLHKPPLWKVVDAPDGVDRWVHKLLCDKCALKHAKWLKKKA
jgi:hypothetical protein